MQLTENMVAISFNTSLQKYGGDMAVACMSILNSVMQFVMLFLPGLVQGAQPLLIPLIFILPLIFSNPVMGVYLAEPIADTIAVCTTAPMFYFYYRKLR